MKSFWPGKSFGASGRHKSRAALFKAAVPFQGPYTTQIIDFHHKDVAEYSLLDQVSQQSDS